MNNNSFKSSMFLKGFRLSEGLTIKDLATKLEVNYRFLSNIENSRSLVSLKILMKISTIYYSFDLPTALSLLASDKAILGANSVARRAKKQAEKIITARAPHLKDHLVMTRYGLLRYVTSPEEIMKLSGSHCDFLLLNHRPDRISATTLVVRDERPVKGQQSLVINPDGSDIVTYDPNYHKAFPSYVISDTLDETPYGVIGAQDAAEESKGSEE
ncbi:helix-turn-helix transcriptional regulator [bacterium]|nr:helix-turn-helix transcriptional regulator [bacterium]